MKKLLTAIAVVIVVFITAGAPRSASADRYSPPDESVPLTAEEQAEAEIEAAKAEQERAEEAARTAREAEARRRREEEAAARRREAARRAAEQARIAEEEAARVAREDYSNLQIQTGIDHVFEGRYRMAITILQSYLQTNPHSADAWYWISRSHHALGDYDRAQSAVNIALQIDPYYGPLTKTPSGLEPRPVRTREQRNEPRPSASVLPVRPVLPSGLPLEPAPTSFPYLSYAEPEDHPIYGSTQGEAYLRYEIAPLQPGMTSRWMSLDSRFNEIGRWRFRVDRMGILTNPRVPVAWRGSEPYEVYFWTGREWARIARLKEGETFDDMLHRSLGGIAQVAAIEGLPWNELETPALAAAASHMRYQWVGDVDLSAAATRAAEKTYYPDW